MRNAGLFVFVVLIFCGAVADLAAQQRGIDITYKARAEADAPVAGRVMLYPKSYALVIGNDAYSAGWSRLSNAVKDAEKVARTLRAIGFDVTLKTNLDSRNFARSIEDWIIQKGRDPEARLFLWYAGHGHTTGGEGYIVPVDAPAPAGDDYDFRISALNMRRFGEWVRTARSRHVYAVFDSCFAGTVFDTARAAPPPAITLAATKAVRQFLTSGGANQTVADDGAFRELFIDAVTGKRDADANSDGYLTASELGLFMSDRVTNYSEGKQTPKYGKLRDKRYDVGDFVFAQVGNSATPSRPLPAGIEQDKALWSGIQNSQSASDFEDYISRADKQEIPGLFRSNAEARLRTLAAKNAQASSEKLFKKGLQAWNKRDYSTARRWWTQAAEADHGEAMHGLGMMYLNGMGVAKNYERAAYWFRLAVKNGYAQASQYLEQMYMRGHLK